VQGRHADVFAPLMCCLKQGEECATITVSLTGYTINNSSHVSLDSPASVTHSVCWYKANGQAVADLVFNHEATCKTGTGEADV